MKSLLTGKPKAQSGLCLYLYLQMWLYVLTTTHTFLKWDRHRTKAFVIITLPLSCIKVYWRTVHC